jgi:hypothetical protein
MLAGGAVSQWMALSPWYMALRSLPLSITSEWDK